MRSRRRRYVRPRDRRGAPGARRSRRDPAVLTSLPAGYRPIVVDNGSTDGSAAIAAGLGALVVHEPRAGSGAPATPACSPRRTTSSASWTATARSTAPISPSRRRRSAGSAPIWCSAPASPTAARGRCTHASANRVARRRSAGGPASPLRDLGPMRAARRAALLALGIADRRFGWPLEMVLRAAGARLAHPRGRRAVPAAHRILEGHRHGARDRAHRARHGRGPPMTASRRPRSWSSPRNRSRGG